jgi:nucleotide-binding universal stress UspA family protein
MLARVEPRLVGGRSDLSGPVARTADHDGAGSFCESSADGVEQVLVRYEDTPRGLAALEHARALADARGARLMVVAVAPHEANRGGCMICRSTVGLYNRHMDEIAEEEIESAATHVGACDRVEFVVAKGGSFIRAIGELAVQRGVRTVVLPAPRGGRIARLFGGDEAELTRRRSAAEVIVVDASF